MVFVNIIQIQIAYYIVIVWTGICGVFRGMKEKKKIYWIYIYYIFFQRFIFHITTIF